MRYYEPFEDADGEIGLLQVDVEPGHHSWRVITAGEIYAAGTDAHERKFYERQIEGAAWPLPRKLDPVGGMDQDWAKLEQDIVRYLHAHIWIADDRAYDLLACWVIASYLRDRFTFMPLLIIDGITVSGKSTLQEALAGLIYHGVYFGNYTPAAITRIIKRADASICLDESIDNLAGEKAVGPSSTMRASTVMTRSAHRWARCGNPPPLSSAVKKRPLLRRNLHVLARVPTMFGEAHHPMFWPAL